MFRLNYFCLFEFLLFKLIFFQNYFLFKSLIYYFYNNPAQQKLFIFIIFTLRYLQNLLDRTVISVLYLLLRLSRRSSYQRPGSSRNAEDRKWWLWGNLYKIARWFWTISIVIYGNNLVKRRLWLGARENYLNLGCSEEKWGKRLWINLNLIN